MPYNIGWQATYKTLVSTIYLDQILAFTHNRLTISF